ncbi:MAG: putative baseplate assembly protein [Pyrinomonadaceae bacterium]
MALTAPKIDERTAHDAQELCVVLMDMPAPFDPKKGVSGALVGAFSRLVELIIERLNNVPDKNFLAFLDLLGASPLAPQPARVPLTFSLAAGSAVDAVVPAGTQVAAPPAEGEKEPTIFETEEELVVTAAQLAGIFVREPEQDKYADYSSVIDAEASTPVSIFEGDRQIEHILYVSHDRFFSYPGLKDVRLMFTINSRAEPLLLVADWELWDGTQWVARTPESDLTSRRTREGTSARLVQSGEVRFNNLAALPARATVMGLEKYWLRCRSLSPVTSAEDLPVIKGIEMQAFVGRADLRVDKALLNETALDLSKEFFPFGEKPKFGDTLSLMTVEAFAERGSVVSLHVELVNPARKPTSASSPKPLSSPIPPTKASDDLKLKWEFWNGAAWIELGTTTKEGATGRFSDTTNAFTKSGVVEFTLPNQAAKATIGGVEGYWIRARIVSGNYGEESHFQLKDPDNPALGYKPIEPVEPFKGYVLVPASFAPPSIGSLTVDYSLTTGREQPESILTYNDFVYADVTDLPSFKPFLPAQDERPTLYLRFTLPAQRSSFPNRKLSLFNSVDEIKYAELPPATGAEAQASNVEQPHLSWEYWNGAAWAKLLVRDETLNFKTPGMIEFLGPADMTRRSDFGTDGYWARVSWRSGEYQVIPRWRRLLLNTIMAAQAMTVENEILGSSDGRVNQKFRTTRASVLPGQRLVVREPEMPSAVEEEKIVSESGPDAISIVADSTGRPREIWVRWHEVPDFYGSTPRDRHYVLDHLTGEISFGDGLRGLIPPAASGNIQMARYRNGGGTSGNRSAGTITQLKTTVPYVDQVTNVEAAAGGADAETISSLIERAPRTLRHQNRAVTLEDYEDLAKLASPAVARARCVPLHDLVVDPDATQERLGTVSLIIVPRVSDPKPLPSLELVDRVRNYIEERRLPVGELVIVGPEFIRVDVEVIISLTSLEAGNEVEKNVLLALSRHLHPLTGGLDGTGWDFGRKPYKSDLYALLERIDGVDHINMLDVVETEDREGLGLTGRFLVYSGFHKISLTFEEG